MAIAINTSYVEPAIPFGWVCNEVPSDSIIIAPRRRCTMMAGHKGNHKVSNPDVEWSWNYSRVAAGGFVMVRMYV